MKKPQPRERIVGQDRDLPVAGWFEKNRGLADLLGRVGVGDHDAFAALYRQTSGHLYSLILRITRDVAHAEDVLQEVYIIVWHAAGSFEAAPGQPLAWLSTIARNRCIDSLRSARRQPPTLSAGHRDVGAEDPYEEMTSDGPGPLELLQRASESRMLAQCMNELSPAQMQGLAMAFYHGLSYTEVAVGLRRPLGTVKSWIRRALTSLRDCLDTAAARDRAGESADPRSGRV